MIVIANAFSPNMLGDGAGFVSFFPISEDRVKRLVASDGHLIAKCSLGHQGAVDHINRLLEQADVPERASVVRDRIMLSPGDGMIVVMPEAGRLSPGQEVGAEVPYKYIEVRVPVEGRWCTRTEMPRSPGYCSEMW